MVDPPVCGWHCPPLTQRTELNEEEEAAERQCSSLLLTCEQLHRAPPSQGARQPRAVSQDTSLPEVTFCGTLWVTYRSLHGASGAPSIPLAVETKAWLRTLTVMLRALRLLGVLTLSLATPSSWVRAWASDPWVTTGTRRAGVPSGLVTNTCGHRQAEKRQVRWPS